MLPDPVTLCEELLKSLCGTDEFSRQHGMLKYGRDKGKNVKS